MKYLIHTVRILLGLAFILFGSNGFLHFFPMPPLEGDAGAFTGALMHSGYFYPIAALQVVGGLCLLLSRTVSLGLTLLGPVIVNIVLYHIFMNREGLPMACVFAALSLFLLWIYRYRFPAIFRP